MSRPPPTLYEGLMGEGWLRLPRALRDVHSPGESTGFLRVERGDTLTSRWIGWAMGLPPASSSCDVRLRVTSGDRGQKWVRMMASSTLASLQWARGATLVELFGGVECAFDVVVRDEALVFVQRGAWLALGPLRLPIPRPFRPAVIASARPTDDGVHVDVRISVPVAGLLLAYSGDIHPLHRGAA